MCRCHITFRLSNLKVILKAVEVKGFVGTPLVRVRTPGDRHRQDAAATLHAMPRPGRSVEP
jgi:hypothetical protein